MSQFTESLNLNAETVVNLGIAYEGYAHSLRERVKEKQELLPWYASSLMLASIFRALSEPQEAKDLFQQTARAYQNIGQSFWRVSAVCGLDFGLLNSDLTENTQQNQLRDRVFLNNELDNSNELESTPPDEIFFELLQLYYLASRSQRYLNIFESAIRRTRGSQKLQAQRVGRLKIPLRLYTNAMHNSFRLLEGEITYTNVDFLINLLQRSYEPIELAQLDSYHWQNLRGSVVPIEPEALAFCIGTVSIVRKAEKESILVDISRDPEFTPLKIAMRIFGTSEERVRRSI